MACDLAGTPGCSVQDWPYMVIECFARVASVAADAW